MKCRIIVFLCCVVLVQSISPAEAQLNRNPFNAKMVSKISGYAGPKAALNFGTVSKEIRDLSLIDEVARYLHYLQTGDSHGSFARILSNLKLNDSETVRILQDQFNSIVKLMKPFTKIAMPFPDNIFSIQTDQQKKGNELVFYVDYVIKRILGDQDRPEIVDFVAQQIGALYIKRSDLEAIERLNQADPEIIQKKQEIDADIQATLQKLVFLSGEAAPAVTAQTTHVIVPADQLQNQNDNIHALFQADPKLVLVVVFDRKKTDTGDDFKVVPMAVKNLLIIGVSIQKIGNNFLYGCSGLASVDLSPLSQVTQVGVNFLYDCSGLTSIDLNFLSQVTQIKDYFLAWCKGLKVVDLRPLLKVTKIESKFLYYYSSLISLKMTLPIVQVMSVKNAELVDSKIVEIDIHSPQADPSELFLYVDHVVKKNLGYMYNTTVADFVGQQIHTMYYKQSHLERIELLNNIQTILKRILKRLIFLSGAAAPAVTAQTTHVIVPAAQLQNQKNNIDSLFQVRPDLVLVVVFDRKKIDTGDDFKVVSTAVKRLLILGVSIQTVGNNFLYKCSQLTSVDVSSLSQVTRIGNSFLGWCSGLGSIDLKPLSRLTQVGDSFLSFCSGLTSVDLSPLSRVTQVADYFLSECSALTSVDLTPLSQVTKVKAGFLYGCSLLARIDLSPLSQVTQVEGNFLSGCSTLTAIDLRPLSQLTQVGTGFLARCAALTSVKMTRPIADVITVRNKALMARNIVEIDRASEGAAKAAVA